MASASQLSINLGLPATPDTKDPDLFQQLTMVYNAINSVARTLDIYTGALQPDQSTWNTIGVSGIREQNITRLYPIFDVPCTTGNIINLYNPGDGLLHARLSNATTSAAPARAYATGIYSAGQVGEVILQGLHPFFSGLIVGALYYTSTTPGIIQISPPSTSGNIVQPVGFAVNQSALWFSPSLI